MVDDLLSGMGLAIGYGVALSIPFVGGNLALLIWGAPVPRRRAFESRMFIGHVFLFPAMLAALMACTSRWSPRATTPSSRGPAAADRAATRRRAHVPRPGAALARRCCSATAAVLFGLGGLVQINPIWLWGPYETWLGTNGAQPDWYLGWLIGGLRLMPGFDVVIGAPR